MTAAESDVAGKAEVVDGALMDLAPSAKLVAKVLEEEGAMPFDDVVRCTRLPRETARNGVDRLVEAGVVERGLDRSPGGETEGSAVVIGFAAEADTP